MTDVLAGTHPLLVAVRTYHLLQYCSEFLHARWRTSKPLLCYVLSSTHMAILLHGVRYLNSPRCYLYAARGNGYMTDVPVPAQRMLLRFCAVAMRRAVL